MQPESPLLVRQTSARRVPPGRIRPANERPVRTGGRYVVYWMTAFRRLEHNFALQRAVEWCRELGVGLVLFEPLRAGYEWACERFHAFVIEGMQEHEASLRGAGLRYYPYLEPSPGDGRGLLRALSEKAAVVVADDWPCFHQPHMLAAAAEQVRCKLEAVDANGVMPLAAIDKTYERAFSLRKLLHREGPRWLAESPVATPLDGLADLPRPRLDGKLTARWPEARLRSSLGTILGAIALPEGPARAGGHTGGTAAARARLEDWVHGGLARYGAARNHPDDDAASGLSPWLHFGMLSTHEVLERVAEFARRSGTEEAVAGAESFADELVTWRELGHSYSWRVPGYARYESVPPWARNSLAEHARDERPARYSLDQLARAATGDPIWNAAQRELAESGVMHNYLRMLWGKKVLAWTTTPQEAFDVLVELNNRYALDGRDPNSWSGIAWVFGRFDRPWGPERPIYGIVRYMTSENTRRKLRLTHYLERWSPSLFE